MLNMIPEMCFIVLAWVLLGSTCIGFGKVIFRVSGVKGMDVDDVFVSFWVGWAALIAFLQVWHLFLPVRGMALISVSGLGMASWIWRYFIGGGLSDEERNAADTVAATRGDQVGAAKIVGYVGAMAMVAFWLANRAMGPIHPPYDAGLYHLNGIRWMTDFPAVPGLGNLHIRFSVMPSYFLYMGLMEAIPWSGRSWNLAHGLLLLVAVAQMIWCSLKVLTPTRLRLYDLMAIMFLPIVLRFCFLEASSTAYDLPVFLLGFVMSVQLARLLDAGNGHSPALTGVLPKTTIHQSTPKDSMNWNIVGISVLSVGSAAVTIKISSAILVAVAVVVLLMWTWEHGKCELWTLIKWGMLPALIGVGWLIRNIIFSGYPLSPSTVLGLPVDWRVSHDAMACNAKVVMAWARDYKRPVDEVLATWDWLGPWFKGVISFYWLEVTIPLILFILTAAVLLVGFKLARFRTERRTLLFLFPPTAGLLFWFFTAPDQRFAGAAFWWLAAGSVVLLCSAAGGATSVRCWGPVVLLCAALVIWFDLRLTKYTRPGPLAGGHYPIPESVVKISTTFSGLNVLIPVTGDQPWDSALPATPYFDPRLALRCPNEMSSGFVMRDR